VFAQALEKGGALPGKLVQRRPGAIKLTLLTAAIVVP
jgi:hypothetical protein